MYLPHIQGLAGSDHVPGCGVESPCKPSFPFTSLWGAVVGVPTLLPGYLEIFSSANFQLVFHDNCSTYRCIFDVFVDGRWAPCPLPSPQPSWSLLLISFREGQNYIQERAQDLVSNPISALPRASHFTWRPHVSLDPFTWFHSILHILYLYTEASYWVFIVHMHVKLWEVLE